MFLFAVQSITKVSRKSQINITTPYNVLNNAINSCFQLDRSRVVCCIIVSFIMMMKINQKNVLLESILKQVSLSRLNICSDGKKKLKFCEINLCLFSRNSPHAVCISCELTSKGTKLSFTHYHLIHDGTVQSEPKWWTDRPADQHWTVTTMCNLLLLPTSTQQRHGFQNKTYISKP